MQKITITFLTMPYIKEIVGNSQTTIERHSHQHKTTEEIVRAANVLGATNVEITEVD